MQVYRLQLQKKVTIKFTNVKKKYMKTKRIKKSDKFSEIGAVKKT